MGVSDERVRRPGGLARLALLGTVTAGFFAIFSVGFPPAARDRLPVLVLALGLALATAWSPRTGLVAFALLFPLAGLGHRALGGSDAIAWPILLFGGFAAGWTFRFLYDFESEADPSRADGALRAVAVLWLLAALAAVLRARSPWALFHRLRLRAVNVEGLLDSAAIRDSVLALASLSAGIGFFFILRWSGRALRERALRAALAGTALSAVAALGERLGLPPGQPSDFWRMTGRLSGAAMDPNALGILCGLGLVVGAALAMAGRGWRPTAAALVAVFVAGLVLSGSRSGVALAAIGVFLLLVGSGFSGRRRLAAAALIAVLGIAASFFVGGRGSVGARVAESFDARVPPLYRTSGRPILWESALRLFERHPLSGAGLGAFSWELPNLLADRGNGSHVHDNPGNAYLQALAETGVIGFLLTAALALVLAREAWSALRGLERSALAVGSAAAVLGMLVVLGAGSHWLAPDVALLFFGLAAVACGGGAAEPERWPRRVRALLATGYAAAALAGLFAADGPADSFRYRSGIGFYAKESGPSGPFYWTARRFAIRVGPGETLPLELVHFTPEGKDVELTAECDGRVVFARTLGPGKGVGLRLRGGATRPRVVRFTVSRAFVPRRLGLSGDRRELGLVAVFPPGNR